MSNSSSDSESDRQIRRHTSGRSHKYRSRTHSKSPERYKYKSRPCGRSDSRESNSRRYRRSSSSPEKSTKSSSLKDHRNRKSTKGDYKKYSESNRQDVLNESSSSCSNNKDRKKLFNKKELKDNGTENNKKVNQSGTIADIKLAKYVPDNIVINLREQTIKIPEVDTNNTEVDTVFHHSLFQCEETRMEKWVKEIFTYRQKALRQRLT